MKKTNQLSLAILMSLSLLGISNCASDENLADELGLQTREDIEAFAAREGSTAFDDYAGTYIATVTRRLSYGDNCKNDKTYRLVQKFGADDGYLPDLELIKARIENGLVQENQEVRAVVEIVHGNVRVNIIGDFGDGSGALNDVGNFIALRAINNSFLDSRNYMLTVSDGAFFTDAGIKKLKIRSRGEILALDGNVYISSDTPLYDPEQVGIDCDFFTDEVVLTKE